MEGDTSAATDDWLERMKRDYPFFPLADVVELRGKGEGSTPDTEAIARIALSIGGDGSGARELTEGSDGEPPIYLGSDIAATPTTVNAIDKFLQTYGEEDGAEISTLEKLIFNPVADYSQQLAKDAEGLPTAPAADGDTQDDRINRFILSMQGERPAAIGRDDEKVPIEIPAPPAKTSARKEKKSAAATKHKPADEPADNSLLSESLAKIYIKNKRYEHAYEILKRLSLAFPEKNAYFADQLRFLRKLILAESYRQKRIDNETKEEN